MGDLTLGAIWAQDAGRAIGAGGSIPWTLPEDMEHFARTTSGSVVIMGRLTWESLPDKARPLPGRKNVVVTSREDYDAPGALTARSFQDACRLAERLRAPAESGRPDAWVIGGASLYEEAIADERTVLAVVTDVETRVEDADSFAPDIRNDPHWKLARTGRWTESAGGLGYSISSFVRRGTQESPNPAAVPSNAGTSHPSPAS